MPKPRQNMTRDVAQKLDV